MTTDIPIGAASEDYLIFGDGIATQSLSIKKETSPARYRVTKGAIKEFVGNLRDEPTKISVDMILHDVVDFAAQKIITTGLDQMESIEDSRKGAIDSGTLWTLYTGLAADAVNRYNLPYSKKSKTSFAAFKNLMIRSVDYSIENSLKMGAFRVRIEFEEVLTGQKAPEWVAVKWGGSLSSMQDASPVETTSQEIGNEVELMNICDVVGTLISGAVDTIAETAEEVATAVGRIVDRILNAIPDILCPTVSKDTMRVVGVSPLSPSTLGILDEFVLSPFQ
ncbi:MAG TPA: hypothetical protein EYP30_04010 [Archaeoglobaceae archaeon]|nr:hypothetical protein [Archaeoglobaceae archaeon]